MKLSSSNARTLDQLLDWRNERPAEIKKVDRQILQQFETTCAVFILDMANFSYAVQRFGLLHHLAQIRRMQVAVERVVIRLKGRIVKFDADNVFAVFSKVKPAWEAAVQINREIEAVNLSTPNEDDIAVSIGIGYGKILLLPNDFFGNEVNLASKLGEDIAQNHEILLTEAARKQLKGKKLSFKKLNLAVSGVKIPAYQWSA
jgi:class 3 adenylate cyclase